MITPEDLEHPDPDNLTNRQPPPDDCQTSVVVGDGDGPVVEDSFEKHWKPEPEDEETDGE